MPGFGFGLGFHNRRDRILNSPLSIFPTGLFAWHDLQTPSQLYADFTGTPASVGQPVAIVPDKSQGAIFGAERRAEGAVGLVGTATAATYNTGTGVGSATRVDISNQSFVTWALGAVGKLYKVVVQNTGAVQLGVRDGAHTGSQVTVNAGATATVFVAATSTGSITITSTGGTATFVVLSICEALGSPMYQTTTAQCPILRQGANGAYYLETDGITHNMRTPSVNLTGGDKVALFTAVRKLSDAAAGVLVEMSPSIAGVNGAFAIWAPNAANATVGFYSKGTTLVAAVSPASFASPITLVVSALADIGARSATLRLNGAQVASNTATQGTGNYGNHVCYYFRRGGTSLPFNGRWFGDIGFAGVPTAAQIAWAEAYYNSLAGAY